MYFNIENEEMPIAFAIDEGGGGTGTSDYSALINKPQINGVVLSGNKTAAQLRIVIPTLISALTNDKNYVTKSEVPAKVTHTSELINDNNYVADVGYVHTDNNFSAAYKAKIDGFKAFSGSYTDLTDKPTIPTATGDLTNNSDFITAASVDQLIKSAVSSTYRPKGSVANRAALPTTGQAIGDMYNLSDTGMNVAWTGTEWDDMAPTVDLTAYAKTADLGAYALATSVPTKTSQLTNDSNYVTADNIPASGATVKEWDATIGTAWTDNTGYFTQTISEMTGMLATYSAEVDMVMPDAYDEAMDSAFCQIYKMQTVDGGLKVFSKTALTVTIPIHVKAVY